MLKAIGISISVHLIIVVVFAIRSSLFFKQNQVVLESDSKANSNGIAVDISMSQNNKLSFTPGVHGSSVDTVTTTATATGSGTTSINKDSIKEKYLAELKALIESKKKYPAVSRTLGEQGNVDVAFWLRSNGSISDVRVLSPSRFEKLNTSAKKLVESVGHFKPIPPELGESEMQVTVPIVYEIGR